ncbi:MAG: subtilisin family serine protease [Limisphaerales bacterium]|jgi:subtilisin family serine protease
MKVFFFSISILFYLAQIQGQVENEQWYLDDSTPDQFSSNIEKGHKDFGSKSTTPMIVAVLDTGVDTEHEDLKKQLWTNEDEIPENGIDDDKNGYIDDIHGWNFLGNAEGENIVNENLEITRLYKKYGRQFYERSKSDISSSEKEAYSEWIKLKKEFEEKYFEAESELNLMKAVFEINNSATEVMAAHLENDNFTIEEVREVRSLNEGVLEAALLLVELDDIGFTDEFIREILEESNSVIEYQLNVNFGPREKILGDKLSDNTNIYYGNNNVSDPDEHGTHVSGIIAAERNNSLGINGVASNVKIMAIRVVPDGDEYDKDVANGIRYAVDNGAQIINMSFGKDYSPEKIFVDQAIRYAESRGVIIVLAAGNDALNIDKYDSYPDPVFNDGEKATNIIVVGASSPFPAEIIAAEFSNYGKEKVDLFAPGMDIYSTVPNNGYQSQDGTSMAAPVVSGAVAFLWSVYPDKDYKEIIYLIKNSTTNFSDIKLYLPSQKAKRKKSKGEKLCNTGGVLNLYRALEMGDK